MFDKVDEREAIAQYQVTLLDTTVDRHKQSTRGGARAIQVTTCGKRMQKVEIGQICSQVALPLEALEAIISGAAKHKQTFSIMHTDVSREFFHASAQRLVLIRLPVEDRMGADA